MKSTVYFNDDPSIFWFGQKCVISIIFYLIYVENLNIIKKKTNRSLLKIKNNYIKDNILYFPFLYKFF